MLTGYGNLPTAVAAGKAGAIDYIAKPVDADDVESALLASPESKASHRKTQCQLIELNGNISIECLNYVTEMFLKLLEDLKCTEELFKEFFLKDHLDKLN
jgi:ActR/RegA family two-component response regulator